MPERIEPVVRIPVDPEHVTNLLPGAKLVFGGVRVKTTIYVVVEVDLSNRQMVETITIPEHEHVEIRTVER